MSTALPPPPPAFQLPLHPIVDAMRRLGLAMFLFGLVLLLISILLIFLLSLERFPVRLGMKIVRLGELTTEQAMLRSKEEYYRGEQERLERRIPTPTLRQLLTLRRESPTLGGALIAIDSVEKSFALSGVHPVHIDHLSYDRQHRRIGIQGTVDDRGGGSIQLLAAFVDGLRLHGAFSMVSEPEYTKQTDEDGRAFSPFTLSLTPSHD